jgi:uncharacterized protein YkwD
MPAAGPALPQAPPAADHINVQFRHFLPTATIAADPGQKIAQKRGKASREHVKGRPMLLRSALLSLALLGPAVAYAGCDLPADAAQMQADLVAGINAQRAARDLPALRMNPALTKAAQRHACDIAKRKTTSHVSANGARLQGRLRSAGYRFALANENTGRGFVSAKRALQWWMDSPHHAENILMRGTQDIGVGIAFSDAPESRLHWVVDMGASK